MTGYGPPPSAAPTKPGGSGLGLPTLIAYGAGGLGVLDFIWGFLDWTNLGGESTSGYFVSGGAAVGLALAAGLWAAGRTLEKDATEPALGPVALSVAALLVVFGNLVGQPDGADAKIGAILALITTLVQAGALVYGWLIGVGRISPPQPKPQAPQGYGPPQGGPQGYGPPPGFGGPQQGGPPPGYAPQGPPPSGYGPPSSYGQPHSAPPAQQQAPQGPPPGYNPPAPPSSGPSAPPPPPGNPYSPPSGSQG